MLTFSVVITGRRLPSRNVSLQYLGVYPRAHQVLNHLQGIGVRFHKYNFLYTPSKWLTAHEIHLFSAALVSGVLVV